MRLGDFDGGKGGGAADEPRIPVPIPPIAATAQVGGQALQVGRPGSMGVVGGDHIGHLIQRAEPRFHPLDHERMYPTGSGGIHVRHDVHQNDGTGNARRKFPGQQHRREPAQRRAHQNRLRGQAPQHLLNIRGEADNAIVPVR